MKKNMTGDGKEKSGCRTAQMVQRQIIPDATTPKSNNSPSLSEEEVVLFKNAVEGARTCRWLTVSEIIKLLTPGPTMYLPVSNEAPKSPPPSGTLLLYDRNKTRDYKRDGYQWIKKQKTNKVREDHVKLRFDGTYRVGGSYVHCATRISTHRRAYHLIEQVEAQKDGSDSAGKTKEAGEPNYILVHYLDTVESVSCMARRQQELSQDCYQDFHQVSFSTEKANKIDQGFSGPRLNARVVNNATDFMRRSHARANQRPNGEEGDFLQPYCFRSHKSLPSSDNNALSQLCRMILEEEEEQEQLERYEEESARKSIWRGGSESACNQQGSTSYQNFGAGHISYALGRGDEYNLSAQYGHSNMNNVHSARDDWDIGLKRDFGAGVDEMTKINQCHSFPLQSSAITNQYSPSSWAEGHNAGNQTRARGSHAREDSLKIFEDFNAELEGLVQQTFERTGLAFKGNTEREPNASYVPCHISSIERADENAGETMKGGEQSTEKVLGSPGKTILVKTHDKNSEGGSKKAIESGDQEMPESEVSSLDTEMASKSVLEQRSDISLSADHLPELVDFTPNVSSLRSNVPIKVVFSVSSPVGRPLNNLKRKTQNKEREIFFAAFIFCKDKESAEKKIDHVCLAPVKQLTPYTFKCTNIIDILDVEGRYAVVLIKVTPDRNVPDYSIHEVEIFLQDVLDHIARGDVPPTSFSQEEYSIKLVTQLSEEHFDVVPGSPASVSSASPSNVQSRSTKSPVKELTIPSVTHTKRGQHLLERVQAPDTALPDIARALIKFENPPPPTNTSGGEFLSQTLDDTWDDEESDGMSPSLLRRKRMLSNNGTDEAFFGPSVKSRRAVNPTSTKDLGTLVDRHCKMRFVERLVNVIGAQGQQEEDWTIPALSSLQTGFSGDLPPKLITSAPDVPKQSATNVSKGAVPFSLKDDDLEKIDNSELENLLDALLVRIVEMLVDNEECDIACHVELNAHGQSGFTLLHYAALYNQKALIPTLLSRGANPDTPTLKGQLTPLHLACLAGNFAIVELLVRHGCAINVKDSYGLSPLDHATKNGFPEIAKWLKGKCTEPIPRPKALKSNDTEKSWCSQEYGSEIACDITQIAVSNLSLVDKVTWNFLAQGRKESEAGQMVSEESPKDSPNVKARDKSNAEIRPISDATLYPGHSNMPRHIGKGANCFDIRTVISDSDRESIDLAMTMMNQEDLDELKQQSDKRNPNGMKRWALQRSYSNLRSALVDLQKSLSPSAQVDQSHSASAEKGELANKSWGNEKPKLKNQAQSQAGTSSPTEVGSSVSPVAKLSRALASLVLQKQILFESNQKRRNSH